MFKTFVHKNETNHIVRFVVIWMTTSRHWSHEHNPTWTVWISKSVSVVCSSNSSRVRWTWIYFTHKAEYNLRALAFPLIRFWPFTKALSNHLELSTLHRTIGVIDDGLLQRSVNHTCVQDCCSSGHDSANAFTSTTMMPIYTPIPPPSFQSQIPFYPLMPTNIAGAYSINTPERRQIYTEAEWEQIRSVFEKLYSKPGLRLVDVQKTMSDEHDFHAT